MDFLFYRFKKNKLNFYSLLDLDAKAFETDNQNNDTHSYLTISDRSDRLYAAVHYDEAEDRKSSSPISLRSITEHKSSESDNSKKSSSPISQHSITGHVSSDSDNSKSSESYLTPVVEAVEHKEDSPRSSDYEDVTVYKM